MFSNCCKDNKTIPIRVYLPFYVFKNNFRFSLEILIKYTNKRKYPHTHTHTYVCIYVCITCMERYNVYPDSLYKNIKWKNFHSTLKIGKKLQINQIEIGKKSYQFFCSFFLFFNIFGTTSTYTHNVYPTLIRVYSRWNIIMLNTLKLNLTHAYLPTYQPTNLTYQPYLYIDSTIYYGEKNTLRGLSCIWHVGPEKKNHFFLLL